MAKSLQTITCARFREIFNQPHWTDEYCFDRIYTFSNSVFGFYDTIAQYGSADTVNILLKAGYDLSPFLSNQIQNLESERFKWSLETFKEATAISSLRKLETEIVEIEAEIVANRISALPMEYADALMCLFDSAGRIGITPNQIFEAFATKLQINKARVWVKNADNSYSHVKEVSNG
jgi:hypothetical protein